MMRTALCLDLIDRAVEIHKPVAVYGLFSGGDDSTTAVHVASKHPLFSGAAHINTGIGVPQTREFVRETCKRYGWPLKEYRAKEDCGIDYRALVLKNGFPGPGAHKWMYSLLKMRALQMLVRDAKVGHKRADRVLLISGVRSQESIRRMGHVEPIRKEPGRGWVWVSPIHDWSKGDCLEYLDEQKVERNEVVALIHKSGECLCGAYADKGELKELACWFPEVAAEIRALEVEVKAAGHNWGWEEAPPKKVKSPKVNVGQMDLCFSCPKAGRRIS